MASKSWLLRSQIGQRRVPAQARGLDSGAHRQIAAQIGYRLIPSGVTFHGRWLPKHSRELHKREGRAAGLDRLVKPRSSQASPALCCWNPLRPSRYGNHHRRSGSVSGSTLPVRPGSDYHRHTDWFTRQIHDKLRAFQRRSVLWPSRFVCTRCPPKRQRRSSASPVGPVASACSRMCLNDR